MNEQSGLQFHTAAQSRQDEVRLGREIERLRQAERARTLFMRAAAHELRGPLTPLLMQLQMGLRADLDDATRKGLQTALRNAERLERLATDLANVGRTEALGFDTLWEPVDLRRVVQEAAASFEVPAKVKQLDLQVEADGPVEATGDHRRLVQVAGNLLNNAIRFTPRGGQITLAAWTDPDAACFRVADTGPGIPANEMENLFQPFHQLHEAAVDGGSGLGLFICRNIVAAHGGQIEASTGKGAVFTVRLPGA